MASRQNNQKRPGGRNSDSFLLALGSAPALGACTALTGSGRPVRAAGSHVHVPLVSTGLSHWESCCYPVWWACGRQHLAVGVPHAGHPGDRDNGHKSAKACSIITHEHFKHP